VCAGDTAVCVVPAVCTVGGGVCTVGGACCVCRGHSTAVCLFQGGNGLYGDSWCCQQLLMVIMVFKRWSVVPAVCAGDTAVCVVPAVCTVGGACCVCRGHSTAVCLVQGGSGLDGDSGS